MEKLWNGFVVGRSKSWHHRICFDTLGKLTGTNFYGSVDVDIPEWQRGYVIDNEVKWAVPPLANGSVLTSLNFIKLSSKFENKLKSSLLELLTEFKVDFTLLGTVTCCPADRQHPI